MVVDDEVGLLSLVTIMLKRNGFVVMTANDARSALEKLNSHPPDLIITDIMMPGMDGIELCRRIRSVPQLMQTPVLVLSAKTDPKTVQCAREAGANDFLSKTIMHRDLIARVRALLGQNGGILVS
jgi:two-component system alkaline phosphatase synthesis response regulator PhoP